MGAISKMPKHRGKVLFYKHNEHDLSGFGFIVPDDSDGDRWKNIWFGPRSTQGLVLRSGDLVDFIYSKRSDEKGPRAYRVWLHTRREETEDDENEITHTGGNW
jgi:cold shock CspA family protein